MVYEESQEGWIQAYGQASYSIIVGANGVLSGGTSTGNNFGNREDDVNPDLELAIAGHKFNDNNGNGVMDDGEVGLAGWQILVDGAVVAVTDADGSWSYLIGEGAHTVTEVNQAGWTQTGVLIYNITLTEDGSTGFPEGGPTAIDFLNFQNASISGTKFLDANGNGIADDTATLAGWTINLDNDADPNNGTTGTTVTAADGTYSFTNIAPGTYVVYETQQSGWTQAYGQPTYSIIVGPNGIVSGGESAGNDFGNAQIPVAVEIGGHKFSGGFKFEAQHPRVSRTLRVAFDSQDIYAVYCSCS